jgi:hypothetical protein
MLLIWSFTVHSLGKNRRIIQFLKGAFRIRPPIEPIVPSWDLHVVLQALAGAPFEPLHSASLKYLILKTAFFLLSLLLLQLVSYRRYIRFLIYLCLLSLMLYLDLILLLFPSLNVIDYLNREVELKAWFPNLSTLEERAIRKHCPV